MYSLDHLWFSAQQHLEHLPEKYTDIYSHIRGDRDTSTSTINTYINKSLRSRLPRYYLNRFWWKIGCIYNIHTRTIYFVLHQNKNYSVDSFILRYREVPAFLICSIVPIHITHNEVIISVSVSMVISLCYYKMR